ncbi:NAD(P)-dependent oxidoreductase [Cellulomonas sp. URHD0024]|uniref:NAD-dependent epimerase/dehydratase family protein n=1 Tax=Cellulomonas sp. URHD0024 TaxID=1302620 RepID=UPI00042540E9|nr:NAD(P)-dependent oxidoreductase [Cellulomonas sp. URHD0024]
MTRVLVTGAEGKVGSAVVPHLLAHGLDVTTLTLPDATPHEGVRVVRGDACVRHDVAGALEDVEAVVHLAAIADPLYPSATDLFGNNTLATFTVLWTAAEAGVRRLVVAGSINATGLIFHPDRPRPARYPLDEDTAADLADPYSLSKHVDEITVRTVCRRFGASGAALRLPLMIAPGQGPVMAARAAEFVDRGAGEGWGWLSTVDGAEAFRLAVVGEYTGAHVLQLAAAHTVLSTPTEDLLDRYAPNVPRDREFPGLSVPIDTSRAEALLGFRPRQAGPLDDEQQAVAS